MRAWGSAVVALVAFAWVAFAASSPLKAAEFKAKSDDFVGTWVGTWSDGKDYSKLIVWYVRPNGSAKTIYAWKGGQSYKFATVDGNSLTQERWGDGSLMVYTLVSKTKMVFRLNRKGKFYDGVLLKQ